jgi:hypothetical protein
LLPIPSILFHCSFACTCTQLGSFDYAFALREASVEPPVISLGQILAAFWTSSITAPDTMQRSVPPQLIVHSEHVNVQIVP